MKPVKTARLMGQHSNLVSLPFKGRARVGMGYGWRGPLRERMTHPHPGLPLAGEG
jgi:hypothetical protein